MEPASLGPGASVVVAVLAALAAGIIASSVDRPDLRPDVDQLWFAARALLDGRNPYDLIGPGREFDYHWQLYYPLPAVLLLTPLAPFPLVVSRISVAALGAGLLGNVAPVVGDKASARLQGQPRQLEQSSGAFVVEMVQDTSREHDVELAALLANRSSADVGNEEPAGSAESSLGGFDVLRTDV
jgi:hypothetical protein